MAKEKIVFVLPSYPDVMYSFLLCFAKKSNADISIIYLKELLRERETIFCNNELSKCVELIYISPDELEEGFSSVFEQNKEAIFVFGGFSGNVGKLLKLYNAFWGKNAIVITEKPSVRPTKKFDRLIRLLKRYKTRIVYGRAYRDVADSVRAILVTGQKGVRQLKSFGIPEEKLYNFMYTHIDETILPKEKTPSDKVKFVYVGRFNYLYRGMDSLIYAFDKLERDDWTLDLVGGYGEDAEEIIEWASKRKNIRYIGSWESNQVINNLQDYDICISPTRIDGWRIQVNQAIMAGIGTITTEEAISDELIKESDTGIVVDAFDKKQLYKAVNYVLDNKNTISTWKDNTKDYKQFILNDRISDYFQKILDYSCLNKGDKPRCPWIK